MAIDNSAKVQVLSAQSCVAGEVVHTADLFAARLCFEGYLAVRNQIEFVPISEPLYTLGRPERDAVPGGTCHCLSTGGIPILSDTLYGFLKRMGAEGETGVLIYRGFNKKAYNTVQPGHQRFLPKPVYKAAGNLELTADLPVSLPPVFGLQATYPVAIPMPRIETQFHIGLSLDSLFRLKESMPQVLVVPLMEKKN